MPAPDGFGPSSRSSGTSFGRRIPRLVHQSSLADRTQERGTRPRNGILAGLDKELHTKVRLTLSSLLLGDGQSRQAETIFRPLLSEEIRAYQTRDKAIRLARKFLPLEDTIKLTPHLTSSKQFQRDQAVTSFSISHPISPPFGMSICETPPRRLHLAKLIEQIKQLLNENRAEAQQVIVDRIKESPTKTLLPSNPLYQNALFLQTPGALDMVIQAAWIQLSIQDLETIISSEDWFLEQRKKALREALLLDPANPVLHWLRSELDQTGDRKVIVSSTLGDPELALRLGHLTDKRETIATAALIASHKDRSTLRCLAALGHSHLRNNNPAAAADVWKPGFSAAWRWARGLRLRFSRSSRISPPSFKPAISSRRPNLRRRPGGNG